ncbi:MAG: phosphatidylserine/phosphatidylglycerophosphate/cardiolipin synthase family protein [Gemmatimonadales bacterium]
MTGGYGRASPIRRFRFGVITVLLAGASIALAHAFTQARRVAERGGDSRTLSGFDAAAFGRVLELLTGLRADAGNRVDLLLNGDNTYPRLFADLSAARTTITMQMYYARPGRVSDTVATILCARARAGVRVLLLVDAFGGVAAERSWYARMRRCGVEAATLRNLQWYTLHSAADRSHVRAVVVDGRVGYTGGFGLADYWLGDGRHDGQWRESNVRFEGPAVAGLQAAFATAWAEATGELIAGGEFFPEAEVRGSTKAGVLFTAPTIGNTAAERFLTFAVRSAQQRLYVTNSYFVPRPSFRRQLEEAADRGVDVRILTVSANTDVKTPWLAGRDSYAELRAHGVRVYEYQPAMMHAKTLVVDGAWGAVGSMNFDNRSVAFNDESNLVVLDTTFGARMDSVFLDDLRYAREMTPAVLAGRPWWERLLERGAILLSHLL